MWRKRHYECIWCQFTMCLMRAHIVYPLLYGTSITMTTCKICVGDNVIMQPYKIAHAKLHALYVLLVYVSRPPQLPTTLLCLWFAMCFQHSIHAASLYSMLCSVCKTFHCNQFGLFVTTHKGSSSYLLSRWYYYYAASLHSS